MTGSGDVPPVLPAEVWGADSSPLILLAKLDLLFLLPQMTQRLIIPQDVLDEIRKGKPTSRSC